MKFLITFIILSIVNVIFSTIKSIATIKSGKTISSLLSGGYYAFYNIVMIYTMSDFPMWQKCLITFICNVVGVWLVKFGEEKAEKSKLWKVEMTVKQNKQYNVTQCLAKAQIPYSVIVASDTYSIINAYCETKAESEAVKEIVKKFKVKYFVTETKKL